jgi:hypothetical protein
MKSLTMIYDVNSRQVIKYLKELQKRKKAYGAVGSMAAASNPGVLRIATATLPVPGMVLLQSSERLTSEATACSH